MLICFRWEQGVSRKFPILGFPFPLIYAILHAMHFTLWCKRKARYED